LSRARREGIDRAFTRRRATEAPAPARRRKRVRVTTLRAIAAYVFAATLSACGDATDEAEVSRRALPRADEVAAAAALEQPAGAEVGPDAGVAFQPVAGRTGPGGRPFAVVQRTGDGIPAAHRAIGTRTFEVALRATPLAQYPCTSCHTGPQVSAARAEDTHQNIQATHPTDARGGCAACHARNDVARLVLQGGETATLDEAYRLCGQCHSPQTEAWAGGAHGKRLVGWRGERVVMGCADCHDPHAPRTPRRIPFRGPVIP
jgi:hypothetical protein